MPREIYNVGDTISPLSTLDLNSGQWKAYVIIRGESIEGLPTWNVFKTTNKYLLKQLQKQKFIFTGGDMATVTSSIRIYKDGKLIFEKRVNS